MLRAALLLAGVAGCIAAQVPQAPPDLAAYVAAADPAFSWNDTHYTGYLNETGWTGA
jgi:hypothetical protein